MNKLKFVTIYPEQSIKDALNIINANSLKSAIVVDKQLNFLGMLTDGNIRRALLKGASLSDKINFYYSKKKHFL